MIKAGRNFNVNLFKFFLSLLPGLWFGFRYSMFEIRFVPLTLAHFSRLIEFSNFFHNVGLHIFRKLRVNGQCNGMQGCML